MTEDTEQAVREARNALDDATSFYAAFRTEDNRDVVAECTDAYADAIEKHVKAKCEAAVGRLKTSCGSGQDIPCCVNHDEAVEAIRDC